LVERKKIKERLKSKKSEQVKINQHAYEYKNHFLKICYVIG